MCELEVDACVEDILNRQEVPAHTCYHLHSTVDVLAVGCLRAGLSSAAQIRSSLVCALHALQPLSPVEGMRKNG